MKVSFSTINPNDFAGPILSTIERKKRRRRTLEEIQEARLKTIAQAQRIELLRNRLLEIHCANINCKNIVEYVYGDRKDRQIALLEANWVVFGKGINGYLCPTCAHIQKARLQMARKYDNTLA